MKEYMESSLSDIFRVKLAAKNSPGEPILREYTHILSI